MPRKTTYIDGYGDGYRNRSLETVEFHIRYWRWGEWGIYIFCTFAAVAVIAGLSVGITAYLGWATYHPDHSFAVCIQTTDGTMHCENKND